MAGMLTPVRQLRLAAFLGFTAVMLGALGAHGSLHDTIVANDRLDAWQKAVFYQFVHTIMLYILARSGNRRGAYLLFLGGILLFSGSLYVWSLTNISWLPHVTPFGGICLLMGWLALILKPVVEHRPGR